MSYMEALRRIFFQRVSFTMTTSVLTNQIVGTSQLGYQDITALNILIREYIAVWVRKESRSPPRRTWWRC
jgi:hypothetical protein